MSLKQIMSLHVGTLKGPISGSMTYISAARSTKWVTRCEILEVKTYLQV